MKEELIRDLEELFFQRLTCSQFSKKYLEQESLIDWDQLPDIVGSLSHFISDEDLRKKDIEYSKMQYFELSKLINKLKQNAPESELNSISFLGYSKN